MNKKTNKANTSIKTTNASDCNASNSVNNSAYEASKVKQNYKAKANAENINTTTNCK